MPRKYWKKKAVACDCAPAPKRHPKAEPGVATPNPSPVPEWAHAAADAEGPGSGADAAAEALERLDVSPASAPASASEDGPPPEPEAPATPPTPSQPPLEASSSGRAAVDWSSEEEEAVRKLQELAGLGGVEVELTEEELRANDQRQEDEICVLKSIFEDTFVSFNKKGGQRSFQVRVHIEIPDGIDVSAMLNYGGGTLNYGAVHGGDASDDLFYKFRVEHLPPIFLTCLLPLSYPSYHPPLFTLSTVWLDEVMISSLCHMLDMIWEEQQGLEVVYQWVQWLQTSSLSHLGFDNEIVLSKEGVICDKDGDKRACPDNAAPDVIIPRMMRYNDDKHHEAFLHAMHDCMICFSQLPGVNFIKLPCHHFFCWKCMQTYCKIHVKEGTVVKLLCPDTKCGGGIPPNILKRLLGEDEFERWEKLLLQRALDSMKDVVYCPRCETVCLEDVNNEAVCSNCLFSFCTLCNLRRHVGEKCLSPEERLRVLEGRQSSGSESVQKDHKKFINDLRSLKEIMRDAKQCPNCRMAISKIEGCNKMFCSNCSHIFCYQCNREISDYDHFRGACVLFPQEEIDRWQRQMNRREERQLIAEANADMFAEPGAGHPCPTCGQLCAKIGNNNHIYCWACRKNFCALCRKNVHKTSQHFGPKGCKQHTADP